MILSLLTFWELRGCSAAESWTLLMQHICCCVDTLPFLAVEMLFPMGWGGCVCDSCSLVLPAVTCSCDSELAAQRWPLAPAAGSGI